MSPAPVDPADACFAPRDVSGAALSDAVSRAASHAAPRAAFPSHGAADADAGEKTPRDDFRIDDFRIDDGAVPAVRDLCWLLRAPALLSSARFGTQLAVPVDAAGPEAYTDTRLQADLARLDAAPIALLDALAAAPERRLGRYAERLLAAWLRQRSDVDVVALGLPVRAAGRTLGECDALFRTAGGAREHWEMAVKFYLRVDDPLLDAQHAWLTSPTSGTNAMNGSHRDPLAGCDAYVGAGLADRLDWKLRRLIEHQLPLGGHPDVVALGGGPWRSRMFVKGRLFHPLARWRDALAGPTGGLAPALAPDHARGWWATQDEWRAASRHATVRWTPLARLEGLAALRADAARAMPAAGLADWLATRFARRPDGAESATGRGAGQPVPVAALRADGTGELSRGFIVPDDWPERARRFRRAGAPHHQ